MIAECGEFSHRCFQIAQNRGAGRGTFGGFPGVAGMRIHDRHSDEIAGKDNQVRIQAIDDLHRLANGKYREMIFVMEITELRNRETIKSFRQAREGNLNFLDLNVLGLHKAVGAQRGKARPGNRSGV